MAGVIACWQSAWQSMEGGVQKIDHHLGGWQVPRRHCRPRSLSQAACRSSVKKTKEIKNKKKHTKFPRKASGDLGIANFQSRSSSCPSLY